MNLDSTDYKILEILKKDGRSSYSYISEKVHLSRAAVRDRILSLEKRGVIRGYTVQINSRAYGKEVSAFFDVEVDPRQLEELAKKISKIDDVSIVSEHTGSAGLHVHALLDNVDALGEFLDKYFYSEEGVKSVTTHILIKHYKTNAYIT